MPYQVDKARVLEERAKVRSDGLQRRRARRLRRQLEQVAVGENVQGFVDSVIDEGVLVTITGLGSLNVTGLLAHKDLPKHLEVPADLKPSFRAQLLAQDFIMGRSVTAGVLSISSNANERSKYHVKLMLDQLGDVPGEDEALLAAIDSAVVDDNWGDVQRNLSDEEEEAGGVYQHPGWNPDAVDVALSLDEDEDDDDNFEMDMLEVYNELKEGENAMPVDNLWAWSDVQDLLAEGVLSRKAVGL